MGDVRALLGSLGLEVQEAQSIFRLLDLDGSGQVSSKEFIYGLMRLLGGAKTVDLATLIYEHRRLSHYLEKRLDVLDRSVADFADVIEARFTARSLKMNEIALVGAAPQPRSQICL